MHFFFCTVELWINRLTREYSTGYVLPVAGVSAWLVGHPLSLASCQICMCTTLYWYFVWLIHGKTPGSWEYFPVLKVLCTLYPVLPSYSPTWVTMVCSFVSHWHNAGILGMFYINIGNPRSVHPVSLLFLSFFLFLLCWRVSFAFQSDSFRDFFFSFSFLSSVCLCHSFEFRSRSVLNCVIYPGSVVRFLVWLEAGPFALLIFGEILFISFLSFLTRF